MKYSVIHPTARVKPYPSFPDGWLGACFQWFYACEKPEEVEYIVVVHISRHMELTKNIAEFKRRLPAWGRLQIVINRDRDCLVDQCNAGMQAATGEIVIGTMDDLYAPKDWDKNIQRAIGDTSQLTCLQCWSGSPRDEELYVPQIVTRPLFLALGLHSTEYESMYADDEHCGKIRKLGRVIPTAQIPAFQFIHQHPSLGTSQDDEIYRLENRKAAYRKGEIVFARRCADGFPRVSFPGESKAEPARPVRKLLALCTPGETFRMEWVAALRTLDTKLTEAGYDTAPLMSYSSNVYKTRVNMARSLMELAEKVQAPDYVLWIDDDNIVLPEQAIRLLTWLETHPLADGIAGWCWIKKGSQWMTSCGQFTQDGINWTPATMQDLFHGKNQDERSQPKGITMTGFPCFAMRFSVIAKLGPLAFQPILTDATEDGFTGEDGAFCNRAMQAGLRFYVDPMVKVQHTKPLAQEPDAAEMRDLCGIPELNEWREDVNGKPLEAVGATM